MDIRFATPQEVTHWNDLILSNPDGGNVLQGYEFTQQKKIDRWQPRFIVAQQCALTVLEKPVFGLGKLWYIPKGPGVTSMRQLDSLFAALKQFAKQNNVFVIKIEPELIKKEETLAGLMKLGFIKTRPIQPNFSTVLVDTSGSLEEIMAHFNQKGRHAVRRAQRDGVTVQRVEATDENCKIMYNLLHETAAGSFGIRSFSYYRTFWQRYANAGLGQLFFAYVNGTVVATAFAIAFGKKGTYKDGASIRERTAYGASHLLQWHVIQWVKEKGATIHDLCGAPPSSEINNPEHPHYGIGRFKTSFNKEVTDYIGAYDSAIKPHVYTFWKKLGEKLMLRYYYARHHESYY